MNVTIKRCDLIHLRDWIAMREQLWPDSDNREHADEALAQLAQPDAVVAFLAVSATGEALGIAEASIRNDYVNGSSTSPVAFLEGLFVVEVARRKGVARGLVMAVEQWARARGCSELASDATLDNVPGHRAHSGLGFAETERVVFFLKALEPIPTH